MANLPGGGGGEEEYDVYYYGNGNYYKAVTSSWLSNTITLLNHGDTCCYIAYTPGFLKIELWWDTEGQDLESSVSNSIGVPSKVYKLTKQSFNITGQMNGSYYLVPTSESEKTPGTWDKYLSIGIGKLPLESPVLNKLKHYELVLQNIKIASFPV